MKIITAIYTLAIFILLGITGFTSIYLSYQQDPYREIISAMDKGDHEGLLTYLGDEVELVITGESYFYTKAEAGEALEDFFSFYMPESFTEIHRGQSNNMMLTYIVGDFKTEKATFRSKILIDREKIVEFVFERSKHLTINEI